MDIQHKSFRVEAKADSSAPGEFTGYASVWDNIDSYGDVMLRGAFGESIQTRGLPAISYEHNWEAPPIGVVTHAEEDDFGLKVKGRLFIEHPDVSNIYEAMKAGGLTEMSFAFLTNDAEPGEMNGKSVRFVKSVDWLEAAVVWKGANDRAQLVEVRKQATAEEIEADLVAVAEEIEAALTTEAQALLRTIDIDLATPEAWEED